MGFCKAIIKAWIQSHLIQVLIQEAEPCGSLDRRLDEQQKFTEKELPHQTYNCLHFARHMLENSAALHNLQTSYMHVKGVARHFFFALQQSVKTSVLVIITVVTSSSILSTF